MAVGPVDPWKMSHEIAPNENVGIITEIRWNKNWVSLSSPERLLIL